MPSFSSSSSSPTWDVFLSFHGKDTRINFTSHLYSALVQAGIRTFRDDPALEKGQEISSTLLEAIRNSNMFIVVLSENYARSPWCLNELAEILSCDRTQNQVVPVFFYVDPSDVRHQKGSFGEALDGHKKRHSTDMIVKWKSALSEIAELSGHHLRKEANENESDIIQKIVENVATRAFTTASRHEKLFGIDSAVEEIYQKLSMDSNDVRVIGICGMGGIGKTTIAKTFYNQNVNKFDISCFHENFEQYSQGVTSLLPPLEQLLIDLLGKKNYKVIDVEGKMKKLKQILHSKKALIVLDDLDQTHYLKLPASLSSFFSAGSRIIITTRDVNLLNKLKVVISEVEIYMVQTLGEDDSLKLFSYHAFRKPVPPESFWELSLNFVTHAGGLPLALKVLGSSLLGRTHESFWKEKLAKVRAIPENDIQKILQLSYDELDNDTKTIFLDIAFFFVGKDKDEASDVLKSGHFFPGVGIQILVDRCLLSIDGHNKFEMHNLIQDMGRELGKTTHLFLRGNAWQKLKHLEEKYNVEGLVLDLTTSADKEMSTIIFERMSNLRLLQIIDANDIAGSFKNLLPALRCIRWNNCPWTHLPSTFCPQNLISIDMPSSKFKTLWRGPMPIKQLNYLTCLYLNGCHELRRLPEQLGDLKTLKKIDASFTAIEKLPDSITHLKNLFVLKVSGCEKLTRLPEQLGEIKALKKLDARDTAIEQLPDSLVSLINLEDLNLALCVNLRNLPKDIWKLKLLKVLNLFGCRNLEQLPEQLGKMQCLEWLVASHTAIEQVPDSIGLLGRLQGLSLLDCKKLRYVPPSIWNLTSIQDLTIHPGDTGRISLPDSAKNMKKLKALGLSCNVRLCLPIILCFSSLERLTLTDEGHDEGQILSWAKPFSLSELFNLPYLTLGNRTSLGSLFFQCFSSLESLTLTDEGQIPSSAKPFSLSELFNLRDLTMDNCTSLPELPLNLQKLRIYNHISLELPDLSWLRKLKFLYIEGCISLRSISLLPSHLQSLIVIECTSLQELPDLSMLKDLRLLSVEKCTSLQELPGLEERFLQVGQHRHPFDAHLPNREVAEWFNYKSSGRTVSIDITPSFRSKFLGLVIWVVYTCKASKEPRNHYMRAVITTETEGITENYPIQVHTRVGEAKSSVKCITGEKISMKSGDRIKVSIPSLLYSDSTLRVPLGREVKVKMFGVHVIQK